ncbi:oligomeric, coiled-coil, peripheral membrane protein [Komagataella kurtzmanii]|nr:oligomeric, coiled-coil, peripheral membrane protein [Komagataella kurtzmanii]
MDSSRHGLHPLQNSLLHQSQMDIYNSITGIRVSAIPYNFNSYDQFKQYISASFGIAPADLFLLTAFGIKLKFSMIMNGDVREVYVFDRRFYDGQQMVDDKLDTALESLNQCEMLNMIKPMRSPLENADILRFVSYLKDITNRPNLSTEDLDLNKLRLVLNSLKRSSGWAAALLSDLKKTNYYKKVNEEVLCDNKKEIEIILISHNALIQYTNLMFKTLEKSFNESVDSLIMLQEQSLLENWKSYYQILKGVHFKGNYVLSDLLDEKMLENVAADSKALMGNVNEKLTRLRSRIDSEIISKRAMINDLYESLKKKYLDVPNLNSNSRTENDSDTLNRLTELVNQVVKDSKELPILDELLTTSGGNSTTLSAESVKKINVLVSVFETHSSTIIPQITELSNKLYDEKVEALNLKQDLQRTLLSDTIHKIVGVQLSILKATNLINNDLSKNISNLDFNELKMSIVKDLPLVFGLWLAGNLKKLKWLENFNKVAFKANEILEMLKFIESNYRSKWIDGFSKTNPCVNSNQGQRILALQINEDLKQQFVRDHLASSRIVLKTGSNVPTPGGSKGNSRAPTPEHDPHPPHLNAINKLLHNFNKDYNFGNLRQASEEVVRTHSPATKRDDRFGNQFWLTLIDNITTEDFYHYIDSLKENKVNIKVIKQLEKNLTDLGLGRIYESSNDKVISAGGGTIGPLNSQDTSYMNLLKKFLKNFEINDVTIQINISTLETENGNNNEKEKEPSFSNHELLQGYQRRVKKLESLLYQQSLHQSGPPPINMAYPPIRDYQQRSSANLMTSATATEMLMDTHARIHDTDMKQKRENVNEIQVLQTRIEQLQAKLEQTSKERDDEREQNEILHLKLMKRDEEGDEDEKINGLVAANHQLQIQLEALQKQNQELQSLQERNNNEIQASQEREIEALKKQVAQLTEEKTQMSDEKDRLDLSNEHWKTQYEEAAMMKKDLLDNMTAQEQEYKNELKTHIKEIEDLKVKVENLEDEEANLIEIKENYESKLAENESHFEELESIIKSLYGKLRLVIERTFQNVVTVCLMLEAIGLLMKRDEQYEENDPSNGIRIHRVKGLRSRRRSTTSKAASPAGNDEILELSSQIVAEADKQLVYFHQEPVKELESLETVLDFKFNQDFDKFTRLTYMDQKLLVESVTKRFKDVEQLARKLQKESNYSKTEIDGLIKEVNTRISIKDFKVGDLVLFLPTRDDTINMNMTNTVEAVNRRASTVASFETYQPWAAFNVGAPHYFLINDVSKIDLNGRDWVLARIESMEEHKVTREGHRRNFGNPYNLNPDAVWYGVRAKEETVG